MFLYIYIYTCMHACMQYHTIPYNYNYNSNYKCNAMQYNTYTTLIRIFFSNSYNLPFVSRSQPITRGSDSPRRFWDRGPMWIGNSRWRKRDAMWKTALPTIDCLWKNDDFPHQNLYISNLPQEFNYLSLSRLPCHLDLMKTCIQKSWLVRRGT